jgi:hypothetical protein
MKLLYLAVIVSLALTSLTSVAQMVPMTNTIRTPYGNVKHTYYVPGPRMNYYGGSAATSKYKFEITFSKDSIVTLTTAIKFKNDTAFFVMKDRMRKKHTIYPSQTLSIKRLSSIEDVVGFPADSCWLFHVVKGTINGYSQYPTDDLGFIAIQNGAGTPVLPLMKENLAPMISGDPKAMKFLEKRNFQKAVEVYNQNEGKAPTLR